MKRRSFIKNTTASLVLSSIGGNFLASCSTNSFPFKKNQQIGCIGDSITAAGGNGYVELLQAYFDTYFSEYKLNFVNLGLSSETITGLTENGHPGPRPYLFNRLERILDDNKLDVVTFFYGINCGIYNPPSSSLFETYKKGITKFLEETSKRNLEVILLTPPPLVFSKERKQQLAAIPESEYNWENPYPEYDKEVLQAFRKIVLETKHPSIRKIIDVYTPLKEKETSSYGKDRIHPNKQGNQLIADTIVLGLF